MNTTNQIDELTASEDETDDDLSYDTDRFDWTAVKYNKRHHDFGRYLL